MAGVHRECLLVGHLGQVLHRQPVLRPVLELSLIHILAMEGDVFIKIDYAKVEKDARLDGLKGYTTNSTLSDAPVIEEYGYIFMICLLYTSNRAENRCFFGCVSMCEWQYAYAKYFGFAVSVMFPAAASC